MRTIGLQWVEFKSQWSSGTDENIGTVSDLTGQLKEILEEERDREIPEAAPAPIMQRKSFKELGTPTAQAEVPADQRVQHSPQELLALATAERARLEHAGEIDTVGDQQPPHPPPLDHASLVGRKVEVRWRYWRPALPGEKGKKKQLFIWCEAIVVEVSDGTIRKSARGPDCHSAGAVRIRWPADPDRNEPEKLQWAILNPEDWCADAHLGWRWPPCELARVTEEGPLPQQLPKGSRRA
eukprot:3984332-Prymnesium_polylepis.1